jgi:hypothetical protein
MELKINNKQKKEMAFRIVKDRWYHRTFDRITNFLYGIKKDTPAYYQIHLSADLTQKKDKWILNNQEHRKTTKITPEVSFHRQFAKRIEDATFGDTFFDNKGIAPFGFEIDMSHVGAIEENPAQEIKNVKEDIEEQIETKENSVNETIPNPDSITDLSDIPIEDLLKMCRNPETLELVLKCDPSLDILEAMVYEVLETIQMLKDEQFLKEKEKLNEKEKEEESPPEYIYL